MSLQDVLDSIVVDDFSGDPTALPTGMELVELLLRLGVDPELCAQAAVQADPEDEHIADAIGSGDALDDFTKHRPGGKSHDQMRHGRRGSTTLAMAVQRAEASIVNQKHETVVVIDPKTGKEAFRIEGEGESEHHYGRVQFSDDQMRAMQGMVLTHNHPSWLENGNGSAFSLSDGRVAARTRPAEMRVVTGRHLYTLRPMEGREWPDVETMTFALGNADRTIQRRFWDAIGAGTMTREEANHLHTHEVYKLAAPALGLEYRRVDR